MNMYVFIDSLNQIKGVCTSEREVTADEVYPGMNYSAIEVENEDIIYNFSMYEFDGLNFTLKEPPEPVPQPPSEIELLQQDMGALLLESANDKAEIEELKTLTGDLILEIANLKAGGTA